ncbi:dihydrofolate reductase, partial [Patescibacteria group bacterium]|nr:dihydrofolate reductase [Patescibacteria group bacterium]
SIGGPLPGRTNIIISRNKNFKADGCLVSDSLEGAIDEARKLDTDEIFVIGGGQIYEQALPLADKLYLTLVEDEPKADTFFPKYDGFRKTREERGSQKELKFSWVELEKD